MLLLFSVGIQKLLKSDLVEPGKTETRLRLQTEHRKNLREFDKKIVTELDEKVKWTRTIDLYIHNFYHYSKCFIKKFIYLISHTK